MLKPCFSTKLLLIKTSVALESTSAYTENDSEVLVVYREMGRYREVLCALRALIVGCKRSFFPI